LSGSALRAIDFLEQLAAGDTEPAKALLVIELCMSSPSAASTSARLVKLPSPLLDHVAEMNAYAKDDAAVLWHARVTFDHGALDFDRKADGVDHATELDDVPSPGRLTIRP